MKKAYITLCNSEKFVRGTLTLYETLNKTGTKNPLIVFMPKKTPSRVRDVIKRYAQKSVDNVCKLEVLESAEDMICVWGGVPYLIRSIK